MIRFLLLLGMCQVGLQASPETEVYKVSTVKGDKTQLMEIFHRIQREEAGMDVEFASYHVIKRVDAKRFLVHPMKAGDASKTDFTKTYLLVTAQNHSAGPKSRLTVMKPEFTDEPYEYVDQYGAKLSVRSLKVVVGEDQDPLLSQTAFIKALKEGQTWTLDGYSHKKCFECFGKGNSGPLRGSVACKTCEGSGRMAVDLEVQW